MNSFKNTREKPVGDMTTKTKKENPNYRRNEYGNQREVCPVCGFPYKPFYGRRSFIFVRRSWIR